MFKKMLIMLVFVGVIFGGIFGYHAFMGNIMKKYMSTMKQPPTVVSAMKAEFHEWQPLIKSVGSFKSVHGVDVSTEIPGIVTQINFKSGDEVNEGQVLLQLNADTDIAQLHALEAAADLAQTTYDRDKKQLEVQAISQAVVDGDAAELKSKKALVAQQNALIEKKTIKAPFAGRLGISTINLGKYINPGESIVNLQNLDSIYVNFYLPQQDLAKIFINQKINVTTDSYPGRTFTGSITAINPKVETDSRNFLIEALIDNQKHELLPGMYAIIEVDAGTKEKYLTLPQTSVAFNPFGETVFVVSETGKDEKGNPVLTAKQIFVLVGETRGDQVAILSGIKEGDLIVTSGQQKLRNGSTVVIDNKVIPTNDPNPKPIDQ
ncbi:MAG: efflux RND transporter periplasmic adaptor subunit [Candidatus Omnitrophica bacterium]|nr:efflux RND transporter periplasmic adaptor subunit [Candidatus Omnitrophota bacterium]